MGLESIVDVSITNTTVTVTRQGFGVALILDYHTRFGERYRTYSSLAGMIADGFTTTDFAYKAASSLVAQNPRVKNWIVGRRLLKSAMTIELTPTAVNNAVYTVKLNGLTATFTADATATIGEITAGLKIALDALAQPVTVTDVGPGTKLTIAATVSGTPFTYEVAATSNGRLKVQDVTTDAGWATDLGDLLAASKDWYAIIMTSRGKAEVQAAAAWAEANKRLLLAATNDEDVRVAGSGDLASALKTSAYARTAVMWHDAVHTFPEAAWAGRLLPKDPGSAAWAYKTLAGIAASSLSDSEITQLELKRCAYYITMAGVNITREGKVSSGEWLDVVLGLDYLRSNIQADYFALLAGAEKVPFTAQGIAMSEGVVRSRLQDGVNKGILVDGSIAVSFPTVDQINSTDKGNRLLPSGTFSAKLQGAILATNMTGTVSV